MKRWLRIGCIGTLVLGGVAGFIVGAGVLWLTTTEAGDAFLDRRLQQAVASILNEGSVEIGHSHLQNIERLELQDVVFRSPEGTELISIRHITARVRWLSLLDGPLNIPSLVLTDATVHANKTDSGIDLMKLFIGEPKENAQPYAGLPIDLNFQSLQINSLNMQLDLGAKTTRLTGLFVEGSLGLIGPEVIASNLVIDGVVASFGSAPFHVDGEVVWSPERGVEIGNTRLLSTNTELLVSGTIHNEWKLEGNTDSLDLQVINSLLGGAGLYGQVAGDLQVNGTLDALKVDANLSGINTTRGSVLLTSQLDLNRAVPEFSARLQAEALHLEDFTRSVPSTWFLDGTLTANGQGLSWPDDLTADLTYSGLRQVVAGQELDRLDAKAHLEAGILHLDETEVDGILGNLIASGKVDIVEGPLDLAILGTLLPEELQTFGVEGFKYPISIDAQLTGNPRAQLAPWEFTGELTSGPFDYYNLMQADELVAKINVTIFPGRITGMVDVDAKKVVASALTAERVTSEGIAFTRINKITKINGPLIAHQLAASSALTVGEADLQLGVILGPNRMVEVSGLLNDQTLLKRPGTGGELAVSMLNDDVSFDLKLTDFGRQTLFTSGDFNLKSRALNVGEIHFDPTPRISLRSVGNSSGVLTEDGALADSSFYLNGALGQLSVHGLIGASGPLDAAISADNFELDMLAELYPDLISGLSGRVHSLNTQLTGTAENPVINGDIKLTGLWIEDTVRWLDINGPFSFSDGTYQMDFGLDLASSPLAHLSGTLPGRLSVSESVASIDAYKSAHIDLTLLAGDFERFELLSPSLANTLPKGEVSTQLLVSGPLIDPTLRVRGVSELNIKEWREPLRLEYDLTRDKEALLGWVDAREGLVERSNIALNARNRFSEVFRWAFEGGEKPDLSNPQSFIDDFSTNVALLSVPTRSGASLFGLPIEELKGNLNGGLSVYGTPDQPLVQLGLNWTDGGFGNQKVTDANLSIYPDENGYDLQSNITFDKAGNFDVSGRVPVAIQPSLLISEWGTGELDLAVTGDGLPLSLLSFWDSNFKKGQGLLQVQGAIKGTITEPDPTVTATIKEGSFSRGDIGIRFENIDMELQADSRRLRLKRLEFNPGPSQRFRASFNDVVSGLPTVKVVGSANIVDYKPSSLSGQILLKNGAWVAATDETLLRVDGALKVGGAWPTIRIDGDLELVEGRMAIDAASFLQAAPLQVDPTLFISRANTPKIEAHIEEPPLYSEFDVDVEVDLKRNLQLDLTVPFIDQLGALGAAVTQADLDVRLGGQLHAAIAKTKPTLIGEVEVVDGKARVLQAAFDLEEGSIIFAGGNPYNPDLDFRAAMNIPNATVLMDIGGTPESPEIAFSSEDYPDQTQIMTILLTGRAPGELSSEEGLGTAQALAGLLLNSLFSGQSLGSLSIEPDGSIRLGLPVSASIYAWTNVRPIAQPDENRFSLAGEWGVFPKVILVGGVGDKRAWTDLYWEIRF